jgi:hypothetical protein
MSDGNVTPDRAAKTRIKLALLSPLVLVNIALIPYVWLRFPREVRGYIFRCFHPRSWS